MFEVDLPIPTEDDQDFIPEIKFFDLQSRIFD